MTERPTLEQRFWSWLPAVGDQPALTRYAALGSESLALSALAFGLPSWLGVGSVELGVFCLFLTAISLHHRFAWLLDEHRALIFERHWVPRAAHVRTAASVLAMFLGMCVAWVLLVGFLPTASLGEVFGTVLDVTGADPGGLRERSFGDPAATFGHNLGVMGGVVLLCFVYRSYGAVLVLAWNASVWVVALSTLTRGADASVSPVLLALAAMTAVLPHLVLELSGYVLAALAAIFASKALTRYDWGDPTVWRIVRSSASLLAAAALVLATAAVVEATWPAAVLQRVGPGSP